MLRNYEEVVTKAKKQGRMIISVAVAQDKDVLEAIKAAQDVGLVQAILVGDAALIKPLLVEVGMPADTPLVDEPDVSQAALKAVSLVNKGEAQVLMKGLVNSGTFLKAVLNSEAGLRTGRLLSHFSAYEIPGEEKLVFHSDGGMNIAPNFSEKKDIITNAIQALKRLGIDRPNVAVLAATEIVNSKMPATVDAKAFADLNASGEFFPESIIEGPIAMDVALNPQAAHHKGITSNVSGVVDLFIFPSIEAANLLSKAIIYYAQAKNSGVVLGATNPIVMVSRADSAESKLHSIALACLLVEANR